MKDHFGRNINYLRLSITDRCNLRCKYCMPNGVEFTPHEQILTYEEFLRVARAAVHLGIPRFKITGGEPLVRKGVTDFIAALKRLPGVEEVTLTTNGVRLAELIPALKAAGVDGVNISLDAADPETFQAITGFDQLGNVLAGLDSTDPRLIEMARVFRVPFRRQLSTVYLSQVAPFLRSGLSLAIGLCWKSGVAAEVIGIPSGSIGEKLYKAKIYLETPDLFCWTVAVVVLSIGCEKLLGLMMDVLERRAFGCWKR